MADANGNADEVETIPMQHLLTTSTTNRNCTSAWTTENSQSTNSGIRRTKDQSSTSVNVNYQEKNNVIKVQKGLNVTFNYTRNPKTTEETLHVIWLCNTPNPKYKWIYTPDKTNSENRETQTKENQKFEIQNKDLHSGKFELVITYEEDNGKELTENKLFSLQVKDKTEGRQVADTVSDHGTGSIRSASNQGPIDAGGSNQRTYQAGSSTNQGTGSTESATGQEIHFNGSFSIQRSSEADRCTNQRDCSSGSTSNQESSLACSSTNQGTSGAANNENSSQSEKTTGNIENRAQVEILIVNKDVDVTFECMIKSDAPVDEEHVRFLYEVAKDNPKLNFWDVCMDKMDKNNWEGIDYENEDCNGCITKFTRFVIIVLLFVAISLLMILSKGSFLKLVSFLSDENLENVENEATWIVVVIYLAIIVILPDVLIFLKYLYLFCTKKDKHQEKRAPRERQFYVNSETNGENGQDNQIRKYCQFILTELVNCLGIMLWIFVVCPHLTSMEKLVIPSPFILLSRQILQNKTLSLKIKCLSIFLKLLQISILIYSLYLQKLAAEEIVVSVFSIMVCHVGFVHVLCNNDIDGDCYSKIRVITASLRIIVSTVFITLYVYLESDSEISFPLIRKHFLQQLTPPVNASQNILNNLIDFNTSPPDVLGLFLIHLIAAYMLFYIAIMACRMRMQLICFTIPLISVPILCVVLLVSVPMISLYYEVEPFEDWQWTEYVLFFLLFPLWIIQIYLQKHILTKQTEIMPAKSSLFFLPSYCTPFAEIYLLHSRKLPDKRNGENAVERSQGAESGDSKNKQETNDMIYICATMWHETLEEMKSLIFSILRVDFDQALTRNSRTTEDEFNFEVHIIFDDAFVGVDNTSEKKLNKFVQRLKKALKEALRKFYNRDVELNESDAIETEYGQRLEKKLPGGKSLFIHLKDKEKIKIKKRWSQVMYMYYLLGFKLIQSKSDQIEENENSKQDIKIKDLKHAEKIDNTYILALDGDVTFYPSAIKRLLARMKKNKLVAATSGRIIPDDSVSGPVVWYQQFEYAIGHWLQKSTEHVFGCVLCSPGCFTLFRAKALLSGNIMRTYTEIAREPQTIIQYDQGEDRWLCTLLLKEGFRVEYYAGAQAKTSVPTDFDVLLKQRKRWITSTIANICDIFKHHSQIRNINQNISWLYISYQFILLLASLLSPSTLLLAMGSALQVVFGFSLWFAYLLVYSPPLVYVLICLKMDLNLQRKICILLSLAYALLMSSVLIGAIANCIKESWYTPSVMFLSMLFAIIFLAGFLHGLSEAWNLRFIPIYFIFMPLGVIFIPLYAVCNINEVSWGTRDNQKHNSVTLNQDKPCSKEKSIFWQSLIEKYLDPKQTRDVSADKQKKEKDKLKHFRNKMATMFIFINLLWSVIISSMNKVKDVINIPLSIEEGNTLFIEPLGFAFLFLFSLVLVLQVIGLLIHRYSTFLNVIAATNSPDIIECIEKYICLRYFNCCKSQKIQPKKDKMEKDELASKFKSYFCEQKQGNFKNHDLDEILNAL